MNISHILHNKPTRLYELLLTPVSHLSLQISQSPLEKLIKEVLQEIRRKNLRMNPKFYLSDEFGCVQNTATIGIPFYLAHPDLEELDHLVGSEKGSILTEGQIKSILRHECGHAFFYTYKVYKKNKARKIFGDFDSRSVSLQNIAPDSNDYVDYLARCGTASPGYSQTHPEEDFADTFGACLDPTFRKTSFQGTAFTKLEYVKDLMSKYAGKNITDLAHEYHKPIHEIKETLESFFRRRFGAFDLENFRREATGYTDAHLKRIFSSHAPPDRKHVYAYRFLEKNKKWFIEKSKPWIKKSSVTEQLLLKSIERAKALRMTLVKTNFQKAKKIYSANLVLMATLLQENKRID
jgi:hypothetical protein